MNKPVETYVIRHKVTGEFVTVPSGKSSWKAVGHAKNAWNGFTVRHADKLGVELVSEPSRYNPDYKAFPRFSEQDVYEIVKLKHESETVLGEATRLLTMCLGRCDYQVQGQIEAFLKKQEGVV